MKHALLSPSGASKWIACPPSARLEENFVDASSTYADEGTHAHKLGELIIKYRRGLLTKAQYEKELTALKKSEYYSGEMFELMQDYAAFVIEKYHEAVATNEGAKVLFMQETELDLTEWIPEGFGTVDNSIASRSKLIVIDLKYGKGVEVSAVENKQMKVYALGVLDLVSMCYDVEEIELIIYQPRINNISTFIMPVKELVAWGNDILKPAAIEAFKGNGEFFPGGHCRFCKARPLCRAYADKQLEVARYEFAKEPLLQPADVSDILDVMDGVKSWLDAVYDYALNEAVNKNKGYPRYKLVESRSNRLLTDPEKAAQLLRAEGFKRAEVAKVSLLSMTELEKVVGPKRFAAIMEDVLIKPAGKPTLVPATDKRPAMDSLESAIADFS